MSDTTTNADKAAADKAAAQMAQAKEVEKVRGICADIDANAARSIDDLVARLKKDSGLKFVKDKGTGRHVAKMGSIDGAPGQTETIALTNWANAARRALKKA